MEENHKYYPKVLVIGNTFHTNSGGGITMSNLFKGWDQNRIAVLTYAMHLSEPGICNTYYQLGNKEDIRLFPFNIFHRKIKSGEIHLTKENNFIKKDAQGLQRTSKKDVYYFIHFLVEKLITFIGIYHFVYRLRISKELTRWIEQYNPEIIYAQASNMQLVRFLNSVYKKFKIPYVLHIMDDYYNTMVKGGMLYPYWKDKLGKEYKTLLRNADSLMSISEGMSKAYHQRFHMNFIPFHNPISTELWLKNSKENWKSNSIFTLMYAGRIGIGSEKSLIDIAEAVEELADGGLHINLKIQRNMNCSKLPTKLLKLKSTRLSSAVDYIQLPSQLSSADVLVLPIDFDKESIKYIKYSMPTKVSEFMITGVPILVYAPENTALTEYAKEYDWALVVSKNNKDELKKAIIDLYLNEELRKQLGCKAKKLALNKHDSKVVCENFRKILSHELK